MDVFTFGRQPVAIDIITTLKGGDFADSFDRAPEMDVDGLRVRVINRQDLIAAKRAAGRNRDLNDIEHLGENDSD